MDDLRKLGQTDRMMTRKSKEFIHEGKYAAEVPVELIEDDTAWSPYLTPADVTKLDAVRLALRGGDIAEAAKYGRVFELTPVTGKRLEPPVWTIDSPGIEVAEAQSAHEFVSFLRRSNPIWWDGEGMPWAFRGHSDDSWALLPSAWRPGNRIIEAGANEATARYERTNPQPQLKWIFPPNNFNTSERQFGPTDAELARQLAIDANAELLPLWDFASTCNDHGLNTPMPSVIDPKVDRDWLHVPAIPLIADEIFWYSDIPAGLALAQHHGLPTRLLDWSVNPLAACFFAVENISTPQAERKIAVWAIHRINAASVKTEGVIFPNGLNAVVQPRIIIYRPPIRDNPYLAAQSGLFTCIGGSGIYYMQHTGTRPALDEFVRRAAVPLPILRKITLAHEHVPEVAEILRREGVNRASFMPTVDTVATDVQRNWLRKREMDEPDT